MTLRRLAVPALAAWLVDSVYGFVVFGLLMKGDFERYPAVFRSFDEVNSMMAYMMASSLVGFVAVAYIFAKGHDGGSGLKEGFWFGVVFAAFGLFAISVPMSIIYRVGSDLSFKMAIAGAVEFLIDGIVLGLVYKPAPAAAARRAAAV